MKHKEIGIEINWKLEKNLENGLPQFEKDIDTFNFELKLENGFRDFFIILKWKLFREL